MQWYFCTSSMQYKTGVEQVSLALIVRGKINFVFRDGPAMPQVLQSLTHIVLLTEDNFNMQYTSLQE